MRGKNHARRTAWYEWDCTVFPQRLYRAPTRPRVQILFDAAGRPAKSLRIVDLLQASQPSSSPSNTAGNGPEPRPGGRGIRKAAADEN